MSFTALQLQWTELWLLLFTYWIPHPVRRLQTFKKQQASASKNWRAEWGCKIYPKATLTSSFTSYLKGQMVSQASADSCHLLLNGLPCLQPCTSTLQHSPLLYVTVHLSWQVHSQNSQTCPPGTDHLCVAAQDLSQKHVVFFRGGSCSLHVQLWCALRDVQTTSQALSLTSLLWHRLSLVVIARKWADLLRFQTRAEASQHLPSCFYISSPEHCALLYSLWWV